MRNISSDIFADEFFGTLKQVHRLLWLGLLINLADDQGRMLDNVALMRSLLFPYDDVTIKDIEKGLTLFVSKHKIIRYAVGTNGSSKRLIQITNWWKYQRSAQWAGRSLYPAPEKWKDRIRCHEKGNVIALINWESSGGLAEATKPLRSSNASATKPLRSREDEVKDRRRRQRRAGALKDSVNSSGRETKNAPLLPNFGKGQPKGFANLKTEKTNGNR